MGLLRLPRRDNPPPEEALERNNSEDEDSEAELSEEESEPGTPPPGPPTPPELRAPREQNEQLERDLQSYGIDSGKMNEIAENMKYQVERMEAEIKRLKEKFAKDVFSRQHLEYGALTRSPRRPMKPAVSCRGSGINHISPGFTFDHNVFVCHGMSPARALIWPCL